jgi:hypothetical protein
MVPRRGLEPPHPKAHGPEPCASTNSAIWATLAIIILLIMIYMPIVQYSNIEKTANSIGNLQFVNQEKNN